MVKEPKFQKSSKSSKNKFKLDITGKPNTDDNLFCLLNEYSSIPSEKLEFPELRSSQSLMNPTLTPSGGFRYTPRSSDKKKYEIRNNKELIDVIHNKFTNKLFDYMDTRNNNPTMSDH